MKHLKTILLLAIIAININVSFGQEIRELDFKVLDPEFIELKEILEEINSTDDNRSIELSLVALEKFEDESIRFDLIVWELSIHYANLKLYDKCLDILVQGQQEGLFYYIRSGEHAFPSYIPELEKMDGYEAFLKKNQALKDEASKTSKADYMVQLPENYFIKYGGQFESAQKASRLLLLASVIAILIIFLILYQEFKNLGLAALVLINLPLALIGGVAAIWLTSNMLSIPAIIGFITLFGIATRNGILLVTRYQYLRKEGKNLRDTVLYGSRDRLNPILMTALASALALIPLAISGSEPGNEIQSPMAIVILGGLATSTFLNLFVIPSVYYVMHKRKEHETA
jgi:preprotein translocase subunit SecF